MRIRLDSIFEFISRRSPIFVVTPTPYYIGNCAEEIYYGLLKARRDGKKAVFLYRNPLFSKLRIPVANRELFNIESDYCAIGSNEQLRSLVGWLLASVYGPWRALDLLYIRSLRLLHRVWPKWRPPYWAFDSIPRIGTFDIWRPDGVNHFSWDVVEKLEWEQQHKSYLPVRLADEKRRRAEQMRAELGIPQSDWFVCLHVRESGFHEDGSIKSHLNSSIDHYMKGIKLITDSGGWVVRVGDTSMTPLPAMERVIDYPHSSFKCALMDIYLISECRFFIGTNSGLLAVAQLFQKPLVLTNLSEWSTAFLIRQTDRAIIKHIFSRSRNRFLSLKEIVKETAHSQSYPSPDREEYVVFENNEEEIRDVIEEFLNQPEQCEYSELQETFNRERRLEIHRWLDENTLSRHRYGDILTKYRVASRTDSVAGAVGRKYLEQNWIEDSMNRFSATSDLTQSTVHRGSETDSVESGAVVVENMQRTISDEDGVRDVAPNPTTAGLG